MSGARLIRIRTSWLHRGVAAVCLFLSGVAAWPVDPIVLTTRSKQFMVRGRPPSSMFVASRPDVIHVDPALLSLVCERVREALQHELGWGERWRDAVFINVHQTMGRKRTPHVEAIHAGAKGWRYRIEMPDEVTRREFLRPIIEVLLLEYANRGARENSVELPPWLVEGMTEHLIRGPLAGLTLHAHTVSPGQANLLVPLQPYSYVVRDRYNDDVLPALRAKVQERGALTVDQLNWPEYNENDETAKENYRTSAHLFLRELLRLRGGHDALCASMALLPESLNWQTAFLRAFDAHFARMLDVEKWWSLTIVQAKSRETSVRWSASESQARLEDVLYTSMRVQLRKDEMPHITPVGLQTLVNEWDFREQEPILRSKVLQLFALRVRVPGEFASLADGYRAAIEEYLTQRSSKRLTNREPDSRQVKAVTTNVIAAFNALDERRSALNAQILAAVPTAGAVPLTGH
ncbi:MAG TPA: hypothetical protein VK530_12380 [Candidatus Acidoferrum sp.]|nr:hypothetical protein [Candidatus Acidoferrum sp.]